MNERLKVYESLLIEKETLKKECQRYYEEYMLAFGDDLVQLFELKIAVVTLKKKIAFCVKKRNFNQQIRLKDLERYIEAELASYRIELDDLKSDRDAAKANGKTPITYDEFHKLRKLFFKIVHLIHPDLHPELAKDEIIASIWEKACDGYRRNDAKAVIECYDRLMIIGVAEEAMAMEDVEARIESAQREIEDIRASEIYQYRFIVQDEETMETHRQELHREMKEYETYRESLEQEFTKFALIQEADA